MSTVSTPFALVYAELKRFVVEHPSRPELVQMGNLIVFDTHDRGPTKAKIEAGDLPELQLIPVGGSVVVESSDSYSITHQFSWVLTTGDQRVSDDKCLFAVEWMLIEAMIQANHELSGADGPAWNGYAFIQSIAITDLLEAVNDRTRNRGIRGWSAVLTVEVRASIPKLPILTNKT